MKRQRAESTTSSSASSSSSSLSSSSASPSPAEISGSNEHAEGGKVAHQESVQPAPPLAAPSRRSVNLQGKLHHELKGIAAAAKRARAFELQRTVKKLRDAANAADKEQLEQDLAALKEIDHRSLASQVLNSKLAKAKLLSKKGQAQPPTTEQALLAEAWATASPDVHNESVEQKEAQAPHKARAFSRVSSNKSLADSVAAAIEDIRAVLTGKADVKSNEIFPRPTKGKSTNPLNGANEDSSALAPTSANHKSKDPQIQERTQDAAAQKEGKVASVESNKTMKLSRLRIRKDRVNGIDEKDGHSVDDASEDEREDENESEGDDTNLPSLSTGFVSGRGLRLGRNEDEDEDDEDEWSDGDADLDSVDEDAEGQPNKKQRKNRMGQRARRALYEKKFGHNANHIRIRQPERKTRDAGAYTRDSTASRRLPQSAKFSQRPPRAEPSGRPSNERESSGWNRAREDYADPGAFAKPVQERPSDPHPSWVAKQQQKEKEQEIFRARAAAASKKIIFD